MKKVYDMEESIRASKYPMATNTDLCSVDITNTVVSPCTVKKGVWT